MHIPLSIELTNASNARQSEKHKTRRIRTEEKQMGDIIPFLKAFLTEVLGELREKGPGNNELQVESDRIFDQMLKFSVSFCNEKTNPKATQLKENVNA